jgi:hypothetical protein
MDYLKDRFMNPVSSNERTQLFWQYIGSIFPKRTPPD